LQSEGCRLAVICDRKLSRFELELITMVAQRCRPADGSSPAVDHDGEARFAPAREADPSPAALIVDLHAFEDVRLAAGQLSAERVTADAATRLQALLRQSDQLVRLDDDRFGVILHLGDESQLRAVGSRIAATLAEVPVPRRASQLKPTLRYLSPAELQSDSVLSRVMRPFDVPSTPRKVA